MTVEAGNIIIEVFFTLVLGILALSHQSGAKDKRSLQSFRSLIYTTGVLLLTDAGTYALIGKPGHRTLLLVLWILVFAETFVVFHFFHQYLMAFFKENYSLEVKDHRWFIPLLGSIFVFLWILSAFNGMFYWFDEMNVDHYTPWRIIAWLGNFLCLGPDVLAILRSRKILGRWNVVIWLTYIFSPILARLIQGFYPFAITYPMTCISILLIHIMINLVQERKYRSQALEMQRKALELQENRQKMLVSQIQPHFLYNVLSTIVYLCRKDPVAAMETTDDFATYLRGNLHSIETTEPVFFDEELQHVKTYLKLEKRRFGDSLNVEYDIQASAFSLPVLSLQPIVENAVKHGIREKEDGGTVKISTRDRGDHWEIVVEDDGVGFDTTRQREDKGRSHIGRENTRKRIQELTGGTVETVSEIGKGTRVTVSLPKNT